MLAGAGNLGFAHLSAGGTMTASLAVAGPDPAALWAAYLAAAAAADRIAGSWYEIVIAGGTGGEAGRAYTGNYQARLAASDAYAAWLAARDYWIAAGMSCPEPS
jgi:hypothetical protein